MHEVCLDSGTTRPLSQPDSALLGTYLFQATAVTGKEVSLLLPSSSKVSDNDVANNQFEFSFDQSFVDGSECLDDQITKKGTTQSLNQPDSALLGAHQFLATALTGKAVSLFPDASSSVSNESNLCPKHGNVLDGCLGTSHSHLSSNQFLANCTEILENEFTVKGTTQSLSWPDSALLGAHQFQATALTGNAVGSFLDSLSRVTNQTMPCHPSKIVCDCYTESYQLLTPSHKVSVNGLELQEKEFIKKGTT